MYPLRLRKAAELYPAKFRNGVFQYLLRTRTVYKLLIVGSYEHHIEIKRVASREEEEAVSVHMLADGDDLRIWGTSTCTCVETERYETRVCTRGGIS